MFKNLISMVAAVVISAAIISPVWAHGGGRGFGGFHGGYRGGWIVPGIVGGAVVGGIYAAPYVYPSYAYPVAPVWYCPAFQAYYPQVNNCPTWERVQ